MILSVIIPVYNEEKTILQILEKIKKNSSNVFKHEIIVIDDGCTDQSRKLLESNENLYDKLLINDTNKGKGYSVKEVLNEFNKIIENKIKYEIGPRRDGDSKLIVANSDKFNEYFSWKPKFDDLSYILKTALKWEKKLLK